MSRPFVTIDHGDELSRFVEDVIEEIIPKTRRRMEETTQGVMLQAAGAWPVSPPWHHSQLRKPPRPHSRDLFKLTRQVGREDLAIGIGNTAEYKFFIRFADKEVRHGTRRALIQAGLTAQAARSVARRARGKNVFQTLIVKPAEEQADALARLLVAEVGGE